MNAGSEDEAESVEQRTLTRWFERFERSIAFYSPAFEEEGFDDLVAALVTGALLERLIWISITFAGDEPKQTLGNLIRQAYSCGLIGCENKKRLQAFKDIRNAFAHEIDYKLDADAIANLRRLLPEANQESIAKAERNILPEAPTNVSAVLMYEAIVRLTFEETQERLREMLALDEPH